MILRFLKFWFLTQILIINFKVQKRWSWLKLFKVLIYKNDVIQFKWPMIGQYKLKLTNNKILLAYHLCCMTSFFIGTVSCFVKTPQFSLTFTFMEFYDYLHHFVVSWQIWQKKMHFRLILTIRSDEAFLQGSLRN